MRIYLARCALVVFSTLILAGCQSGDSAWRAPNWSLSKLNPFASLPGLAAKTPHPERPSTLVSPTSPTHPAAGYVTGTSGMTEPSGQYSGMSTGYDTPPGGYSSTQWHRYSPTQSSSPASYATAGGATSGQSTVAPQDGSYDPNAGYRMSQQSSFSGPGSSAGTSPYSSDTSSTVSGLPDVSSYRSANQDYNMAGATGPYGYASGAAPEYGATSGRYGSVPPASDPYDDLQNQRRATANLYANPDDRNKSPYTALPEGANATYGDARWPYETLGSSRYPRESGSTDASPADGRYSLTPNADYYRDPSAPANYGSAGSDAASPGGSGSSYDSRSPYSAGSTDPYSSTRTDPLGTGSRSLVGDRYAQPDAASTSSGTRYDSYINGQSSSSEGTSDWNPGDTGYSPGGRTANMPGRTDYDDPGNTGYNRPGVSPYRSPADSYTSPSTTADLTAPFLPGSTKR